MSQSVSIQFQEPQARKSSLGGLCRERIHSLLVSKKWLMLFTLLQVALMVPYMTFMVPHLYEFGLFPLRPAYFMVLMGVLNLVWLVPKKPDFTKTTLLFVALIGCQAADAAILQRFVAPAEHGALVMSYWAALFMAVVLAASVGVLYKTSYQPALLVAVLTIFITVASVIAEYLGYGKFTNVPGRPSGFWGDPNNASMAMLLMLGIILTLSKHFWFNMFMVGVTACGVFPTLSRSGYLVFVCIIAAYVILNLNRYFMRFVVLGLTAVPVVAAVGGLLVVRAGEGGKSDENSKNRIEALFQGDVSEMGSSDRMRDLRDAIDGIVLRPVAGYGAGAGCNIFQPHNQLLRAWVDLGLLGFLLYAAVLALVVWKSFLSGFSNLCVVIPLVGFVPFSQILMENYAYFFALGIAIMTSSRSFLSVGILRPGGRKGCAAVHFSRRGRHA